MLIAPGGPDWTSQFLSFHSGSLAARGHALMRFKRPHDEGTRRVVGDGVDEHGGEADGESRPDVIRIARPKHLNLAVPLLGWEQA